VALAWVASAQTYNITTVAGNGSHGYSGDGSLAVTAQFDGPSAIAVDTAGNWYIADLNNKRIRKVSANGKVSTLAGGGSSGRGDGGPASKAQLISPYGVAVDGSGDVYIADGGDSRVRKVSTDGAISTVAGGGSPATGVGDGGPAVNAMLSKPYGLAFDHSGNLFIADADGARIRKVGLDGVISTVAGGGMVSPGDNGPAVNAQLERPTGVAVDWSGNIYVADRNAYLIRKVSTAGIITTVAGGGSNFRGDGDQATNARLYGPVGVAVDSSGRLFFNDERNSYVFMVTPGGVVFTVAGNLSTSYSLNDGGPATSATLSSPAGLALGGAGTIYVADPGNQRVRLLTPVGQTPKDYTIQTVAGTSNYGYSGDGGLGVTAQLNSPKRVAVDSSGNVYISDNRNSRVRKLTSAGVIATVAGNGTYGYSGDGGDATKAQISYPGGIAVDSAGNLYIADYNNSRIRKVTPQGTISTVAGKGWGGADPGDNIPATQALLMYPTDVAVDASGNMYIADSQRCEIRKVDTAGIITVVAGNGTEGYTGDGGLAANAEIGCPNSVAVDSSGNIYTGTERESAIRKISPSGIISTVAGDTEEGFYGDGGPAVKAVFDWPEGIAVDAAGNLYIADSSNQRIRRISLDGIIETIAGSDSRGGYDGDGRAALDTLLSGPNGVAVDAAGNIYVADSGNNRVRVLNPPMGLPAISSGGVVSALAFGGFTSVAPGSWLEIYGSNLATTARSWTGADFDGIYAPTALDGTSVTIGGQPAFVDYVSATQVDVQLPSTIGTGPQPLVTTNLVGDSQEYTVTVVSTQPGLLAPYSFAIGGQQYVAATFGDGSFVLPPGAMTGLTTRRAAVGDTVILWGIGFGAVTPDTPAGQVVQQSTSVVAPFRVYFGSAEAAVSFAGLAPGTMGLYQFNVTVPNVASSDSVPLSFTLDGIPASQQLYIAVQ
jgi:uncharacterized protein (TIGR03437 family)